MKETIERCDRCRSTLGVVSIGLFSERYIDASGNYDTRCIPLDLCKGCISSGLEGLGQEKLEKFMGKGLKKI